MDTKINEAQSLPWKCSKSSRVDRYANRKYHMTREMLIDILQSIMEALRTETSVKMSEIFENYTPLGIVETTLTYLPQALQWATFIPHNLDLFATRKKGGEAVGGDTAPIIIQIALTMRCWCTKPALQGADCWSYTMTHPRDILSDGLLLFFSTLGR